jgi:L-malate glycosyltransferase
MKVLFVSHTRGWSGAEVAMMRLVDAVAAGHEVAIACPTESRMAAEAQSAGVRRYYIPAIDASLRLDPVWTPVGLAQLALGGAALRRATYHFRPDIVHANSFRAGLLGAIGLRKGRPPMVVQAHEHLPTSRAGRAIRGVIASSAECVVCVSDHTARNFTQGLESPLVRRIYNSIDLEHLSPSQVRPAPVRAELGLSADAFLLGEVAQITPWKGQDTAIRVLAEMRARDVPADLLIVGHIAFAGRGVRYDNHSYLRDLHQLANELQVAEQVHFLGWRDDVPQVLRALDLSLLPSRDEPFGISVAESMAVGTPAIVCTDGGPTEFIVDRESGRVLPPDRADLWAEAAAELASDRRALARMSQRATAAVASFTDTAYTGEMLDVYRSLVHRRRELAEGARRSRLLPVEPTRLRTH